MREGHRPKFEGAASRRIFRRGCVKKAPMKGSANETGLVIAGSRDPEEACKEGISRACSQVPLPRPVLRKARSLGEIIGKKRGEGGGSMVVQAVTTQRGEGMFDAKERESRGRGQAAKKEWAG